MPLRQISPSAGQHTVTVYLREVEFPAFVRCPSRFADVKTGDRKAHVLTERDSFGEPVFVPRSADAGEGDGVVGRTGSRSGSPGC